MDNKVERVTYSLTNGKDNTIKQFVERFYIVPKIWTLRKRKENF